MTGTARSDGWVEGAAGRLRVTRCGSGGTPVLFVHGNTGNRRQWDAQLAQVCRTRPAVAFDLRGMGESAPAADGDYSPGAMAEDVRRVADALSLQRFVLVGHSYGAAVVAAFLARYPERLAGAVHADGGGSLGGIPEGEVAQFLANFSAEHYPAFRESWFDPALQGARPETREQVMASVRATPREVVRGALAAMLSFDPVAAVRGFSGPQLAIAAESQSSPFSLVVQAPELPRRMMAGVSHWLMMDAPAEFNRHLEEFLAGLGEGAR